MILVSETCVLNEKSGTNRKCMQGLNNTLYGVHWTLCRYVGNGYALCDVRGSANANVNNSTKMNEYRDLRMRERERVLQNCM